MTDDASTLTLIEP